MDLPLLEPAGFLAGPDSAEAVAAGLALPLLGGPASFTLARLHAPGRASVLMPVDRVGSDWRDALATVTAKPPDAGLPPGTLVMGILNATPDSFATSGLHLDPQAAIAAGRAMAAAGAAILDIGGESTRPGAVAPPVAEELRRVTPVLTGLAGRGGALLSIDTRRAPVMAAALDAGAAIVNDVSALAFDRDAAALLARAGCTVVLMHMRGTPETMRSHADYADVAVEVTRELAVRIAHAEAAGISRARIVVDPGIGFAKTAEQNLELLRRLPILANLGCRVLLGVSRKSFIGALAGGLAPASRVPGTLAAMTAARFLPGTIHRVHDVAEAVQALAVTGALCG